MSEIICISIKGFVIGFVSYFLYSLYQTRKERNRKPKLLELYLPTHLGFKVKHKVEIGHWLLDKDYGITPELRTISEVIQEYKDLVDYGVCIKVPKIREVSVVSGKVYVRGKEVSKYFY